MKRVETSSGELYVASEEDVFSFEDSKPSFDIIWNMARELQFLLEEEKNYADYVFFGDVPDYGIPSDKNVFEKQLNFIVKALQDGMKVMLHCLACHGRSGLALACIKKRLDKMNSNDALAFAYKECKGPETEAQKSFVRSI